MKLKSKWVYNYAKGLKGSTVSEDYYIENDDLIFALTWGYDNLASVILKLNLDSQQCQTIFEEKHVLRTAGIPDHGCRYLTSFRGAAYCINDAGEKVWATKIGDGSASFKITLDEKHFYVSSYTIFCLDKGTGEIVWKDEKHNKKVNCNILLHDQYLYCGELGGKVFCLDKTNGKTIWEFGEKEWISNIEMLSQDKLLVSSNQGWFYIVNAKTGNIIRKIQANGRLYGKPLIEGNKLYVGDQNDVMYPTEGNMTCYIITENDDLIEQFKFPAIGGVTSNILIDENKLFFATESGYVYCIDKITGEELMTKKRCKGVCRNLILKDQKLIALSDKGHVECFEII